MLERYWNHLWDEMSGNGRKTFPWDILRGAAAGAVETVRLVFALLIAIKYFEATDLQKSFIAGAIFGGMILSMPYAAWSVVLKRKSVRAAIPAFAAAGGLTVAGCARSADVYSAGIVFYGLCSALSIPIMTGIYRDNYRGRVRGQVYGITVLVMVVTGLAAQSAGGKLLENDMSLFRALFFSFAAMNVLMGYAILRMPDQEEPEKLVVHPLASLAAVRENPMFGYVLFAWFLFGFANLTLMPQRIEYLSQPQYGFDMSPGRIVLIVGVTMEVTRLIVIPVWARLFDRYNFIFLRIGMNSLLIANMIIYFNSRSVPALVFGSACLGAALGGGKLAWQLWVTKFAPPEQTARYMSVHTFFTGVRGVIGPGLGYLCSKHFGIHATSWVCAGLVIISIILLWRIRNKALRV